MGELQDTVILRWAREEDWPATMKMIWKTFLKFEGKEYTGEGIRSFFDFITDDRLFQMFRKGTYQVMIAENCGQIVGAASLRGKNLLSLLFVKEEYHRRGIGSSLIHALCEYLQNEMGEHSMTVQSSPYAVNFYRKLGFVPTGEEEDYSGIRVTPMEMIF
ncbi:MAG: GNAT family N-acetyltransferase [Acetatifactor sp.]